MEYKEFPERRDTTVYMSFLSSVNFIIKGMPPGSKARSNILSCLEYLTVSTNKLSSSGSIPFRANCHTAVLVIVAIVLVVADSTSLHLKVYTTHQLVKPYAYHLLQCYNKALVLHDEARAKDALKLLETMFDIRESEVPEGDETEKWLEDLFRGEQDQ